MLPDISTSQVESVILLILVVFFLYRYIRYGSGDDKLGKLIWLDEGKHIKPFFNSTFNVLGKPDAMYKKNGSVIAVEYKSRKGRVFQSDIVQALTAALAAFGEGYKVRYVLIQTKTDSELIELPKSPAKLHTKLEPYLEIVRKSKLGFVMEARPEKRKCRACAYRYSCDVVICR